MLNVDVDADGIGFYKIVFPFVVGFSRFPPNSLVSIALSFSVFLSFILRIQTNQKKKNVCVSIHLDTLSLFHFPLRSTPTVMHASLTPYCKISQHPSNAHSLATTIPFYSLPLFLATHSPSLFLCTHLIYHYWNFSKELFNETHAYTHSLSRCWFCRVSFRSDIIFFRIFQNLTWN